MTDKLYCVGNQWMSEEEYKAYLKQEDRLAISPQGWQPIESAPKDCEFLAYGSYLYPGDADMTDYIVIAELSGGDHWPYRSSEGLHCPEFFTHWMPLPKPPKQDGERA